jgi:hypothetical protein
MRPLTVLLGILMGSIISIALGLVMVMIIYLVLSGEHAQLKSEQVPLLRSLALFLPLAAVAVASFVGELKRTSWRYAAFSALGAGFALMGWMYWPAE